MREVGVHDDDEVSRGILQAVNVCGAEAEFAGAGVELYSVGAVGFDELLCDGLRAVWRAIVDDDDLPVELTVGKVSVLR